MPPPGTGPAPARRFPLALPSQRALQIVLGLFWVLDSALQFQPFMFGRGFVQANILANAQGQPFVIGDLITHIGNFLAPDIAVWNTLFALIQLAIGLGLLYRPTVRPALAVSFAWALGVWFFGEGLGMVFTGAASALTGAPGSVLVYGLLGLMAWPHAARAGAGTRGRRQRRGRGRGRDGELTGVASSAAAQGIGRSVTPLAVWAGFWSLAAVLFLFPDNRTPSSVSSAVVGMAQGEPSWYGHFLNSLGHQFSTSWHPDVVDPGPGVGGHRPGPAGGASRRVVPGRRRPVLPRAVGGRPGPAGQRVQRFGHRSQHGAARDSAGPRHDAAGGRPRRVVAFAGDHRGAARSGPGHARGGRARCRAGAQRHLPGGAVGVGLHGHVGHGHGQRGLEQPGHQRRTPATRTRPG